jgi:type III secretory pathway component EscS
MEPFLLDAIVSMLTISIVPLAAVAIAGATAALVQAITQVQEASVSHLVRLCAFSCVAYLLGLHAFAELTLFLERACRAVELIGRSR